MKTAKESSIVSLNNQFSLRKNLRKTIRFFAVFSICLIIIVPTTSALSDVHMNNNNYTLSVNNDAFEVETHNIKIDIINEEEVNVAERYEIRNKLNISSNSIYLWINQSLENLYITDTEGEMVTETTEISASSNLLKIDFRSELAFNDTSIFNIWYGLANSPIQEQGNSYYFFEFFSFATYFIKEQEIEMKIPERSLIHEEEGITPYYPLTENPNAGKRIYISWSFRNILPLENSFVFIRFDKPLGEFPIWTVIVGPILGLIVGTITTIYFMRRKSRKTMKKIATIYLSDTQKLLLKLISESNGKILQKELCTKTGFTKSRISRNITPMVEQKLVNRQKWGRNYILTLTENGEKVVE